MDGQKSYMCPKCRLISHCPQDVENEYCGNCHKTRRELKFEKHMANDKGESRFTDDDVAFLAYIWERLVSKVDYPSRGFALQAFDAMTLAFLRGAGVDLPQPGENDATFFSIWSDLTCRVLEHVFEAEGTAPFPTLRRFGFDSYRGAAEIYSSEIRRFRDRE